MLLDIIDWTNSNNGFIMALLTFVYVIATILICIFNYKSAKATKEQTKESYNQFIENSRAHIVPKIIVLEGEMLCLAFQNIGHDIALDVVIDVNEEWLGKLEKTKKFSDMANKLRNIKNKKLFLTVDQQICYGMCIVGDGTEDYKKLAEDDLIINISYKSLNNSYNECFNISLDAYNYIVDQLDYTRLTKKQIAEMRLTNVELKKINDSIKNNKNVTH